MSDKLMDVIAKRIIASEHLKPGEVVLASGKKAEPDSPITWLPAVEEESDLPKDAAPGSAAMVTTTAKIMIKTPGGDWLAMGGVDWGEKDQKRSKHQPDPKVWNKIKNRGKSPLSKFLKALDEIK